MIRTYLRRALRWCLDSLVLLVLVPVAVAMLWLVGWILGLDYSDDSDPEQVEQWGGARWN